MPDIELYKLGRVMELDEFRTRVRAAVIKHASTMSLFAPINEAKNYAIFALKNPDTVDTSMVALVAADPVVLAAVTMVDDALANADNVTDASITAVVVARWALVANKYPVIPVV